MPSLTVNALGVAPGGGLSYALNQLPHIIRLMPDWTVRVVTTERSFQALTERLGDSVVQRQFASQPHSVRRAMWEQSRLGNYLSGSTAVYHLGGFALLNSPIPQVVVHHNPNHYGRRTEVGSTGHYFRARGERILSRATCRHANATVAVSESHATGLRRVGYGPNIVVVPSALPEDIGRATALDEEAAASICAEPFALAIHNWYTHKNLPWLLQHWRTVARTTGLVLVLVGSPVKKREATRVRQAASDAGESVRLVSSVPRGVVSALLADASLYLSASRLEAFPLTPVEAMASSLPCVLSDIPPHREVVRDAGRYFSLDDDANLTDSVVEALSAAPDIAARGLERSQKYTWHANAQAVTDIIREAAASDA